jgi:hypothetical protein
METPSIKIHSCSEIINNVDYIDVNFSTAALFNIPTITVTTQSDEPNNSDVNVHISNVTITSARLNFSAKFVGTVKYTVISVK